MNALALLFADKRRRRFFHQLLVASLQRAITRTQHHHIAMRIGHYLGFDMAGLVEELLDEAFTATKGRHRFAHG